MRPDIRYLDLKARWVRRKVLDMVYGAGAGHIASAFSCTDILVALYYGKIIDFRPEQPKWPGRDRFILSKGHGCAALYSILADLGTMPLSVLDSYCSCGSLLGGHSESNVPGVETFTGSLGHGLSIGAGIAFAAKFDRKKYFTYVLLGDGECQEGSVWEAAMFAAQHRLGNLVAIVDRNRQQAISFTEETVGLEPFDKKWAAFGWETVKVDGHSLEALMDALAKIKAGPARRPVVLIADTVKGKAVSYMEREPIWHFRAPDKREYDAAIKELMK